MSLRLDREGAHRKNPSRLLRLAGRGGPWIHGLVGSPWIPVGLRGSSLASCGIAAPWAVDRVSMDHWRAWE